MIESPLIQEFVHQAVVEEKRRNMLIGLRERFGSVPPEIVGALELISDDARLEELLKWTFRCPDLESFRERVSS